MGLCHLGKWLLRRLRLRYVIGTDKEGKELNRLINQMYPALILFDASFYGEITARRIGLLLKNMPGLNIAVFSFVFIAPERAVYFLLYGARSYLDLSGSGNFWRGLKMLVQGREYVIPSVKAAYDNLPDCMPEVRLDTTGRQEDVKLLILRGKKTKEIAAVLSLSVKTVENHKTALFENYGVKNALELFRKCFLLGELDDSSHLDSSHLDRSRD
jgi:DNA-binding NarL/FixJ family response regulator